MTRRVRSLGAWGLARRGILFLLCVAFLLPTSPYFAPAAPAPVSEEEQKSEGQEESRDVSLDLKGTKGTPRRGRHSPASAVRPPALIHHSTTNTSAHSRARSDPFGNGLGTRLRC
jgi:hypothetical protein